MTPETTFQHDGICYATVRVLSMSGRQTIDGATLMFNCELDMHRADNAWLEINDFAGHVSVDGIGDLGPCWSLNSFRGRSGRGEKASFFVCVAAKEGDIRAIDHLRARSNRELISFILWLRLRGASTKGPVDSQGVLNVTVTTSDWFAALAAAQYESRHMIDVPLQGGRVSGALSTAAEHYRRAVDQWKKASYSQVFTECRKVLESTRDVLALKPRGIAEIDARTKNAWSNRECVEYARAAIHQIVHHSAHPGVDDDPGPAEAELLLGLTGSLLRYFSDSSRR